MLDQPCRVERVARDQQLHAMTAAQIWSDDDPLGRAIPVQKEHLQRITKVVVIELVVADPVKAHRRARLELLR